MKSAPPGSVAMVFFASAEDARQALPSLHALDDDVQDAAIVVRTGPDRLEVDQTAELASGEGAILGGAAGLVAGVLLGIPVVGALGGILGGGAWGLRDTGIPNERLRELGRGLEPGHAVLCVLAAGGGLPRVRQAPGGCGEALEGGRGRARGARGRRGAATERAGRRRGLGRVDRGGA